MIEESEKIFTVSCTACRKFTDISFEQAATIGTKSFEDTCLSCGNKNGALSFMLNISLEEFSLLLARRIVALENTINNLNK